MYLWPTCTMILLRSVDLNWLWLAGRFLWEIKSVKLVWWSSGLCLQCVHLGVLSISLSILDITRYWHNTMPGALPPPTSHLHPPPPTNNFNKKLVLVLILNLLWTLAIHKLLHIRYYSVYILNTIWARQSTTDTEIFRFHLKWTSLIISSFHLWQFQSYHRQLINVSVCQPSVSVLDWRWENQDDDGDQQARHQSHPYQCGPEVDPKENIREVSVSQPFRRGAGLGVPEDRPEAGDDQEMVPEKTTGHR